MVEQMKPSGIDWIKNIPISWNINKVKYLATDSNTLFLDGDWIESDVIEDSGIRYLTTGNVGTGYYKDQGSGYISQKTFDELHCLKVVPGDLMISRLNEPIGRACIVPDGENFYVVAVNNVILRPNKEYNKKFIMYAMNTDGYAEYGNIIARGATMSRVSRSQLGQFWIAYPDMNEQNLIADFLDKQCGIIDEIISDLEKQIEILQKFKKSLILETVTKGLNKNVPMKPSGIDWIGDIPATWDIKRIKDVSKMQTGTTPPNNEGVNIDGDGVNWFTPGDFIDGSIELLNSEKFVNDETIQRESIKIYPKYSILFVGIASIGKLGYFENACYSNQQITAIKTNNMENSKFIAYSLMASMDYTKSNALYTTVPIINNAYLGVIKIPFPKEKEQKEIVFYLDKKCLQIDEIVKGKKEQLEKIKQHKKSLIYEYVTGKKRVKEATNGN